MTHMTFEDLKLIITECAGEDEQVALGEEALDVPFTDLGYDSLALLETAAVVAQRFGVELPDDEVGITSTPREFLNHVNGAVTSAA
ncbi:MAG: minimal acyl carrier protein [Streptomyces sp.]|jgi:act minimal PKS acyl carrier protein|nr:minimal acyl carrier protein [Streptomyces sp.]